MTQEKPKAIRVLQTTKKSKKASPKYLGITAITVGVLATSALLFTFLNQKDDHVSSVQSSQNTSQSNSNIKPAESETSLTAQNNAKNIESDQLHPNDDGFNEPQPKMNEITNVFKHKKETKQIPEPVPPSALKENANPFNTLDGSNKSEKPTLQVPTVNANLKPQLEKPAVPPTLAKKPAESEKKVKAPVAEKAKEAEKEPEYEVPHASVQVTVTKSVKE